MNILKKNFHLLFIICTGWFILLCLLHYLSARPLWLDEGFVLNNIQNLNYSEILTHPLSNNQAFPRVYLVLIKFVSRCFNYNVFSLRFFSLVFMLSAFFVWSRVYKKELGGKWLFLFVLFSWASSCYFSYYAAELKQYSMDVLVIGIFTAFILYQRNFENTKPPKSFIIFTMLLPFSIFFSYASFFVFWIVSYNFFLIRKENKLIMPLFWTYTLTCFFFGFIMYSFDLVLSFKQQGLFLYWKDYFLCTDSFYCFIKSFTEGMQRLSIWWFGNSVVLKRVASFFIPFFVCALFGYGGASFRKNRFKVYDIDSIGLVVFMELLVLGLFKIFPFTGERITLFFAPFVFYLIIKGMNHFRRINIFFNGLFFIFLIFCSFNSLFNYLKLYKNN